MSEARFLLGFNLETIFRTRGGGSRIKLVVVVVLDY